MIRRRDFVIGAAGVAGAIYAGPLRAQDPCPPDLSGASSPNNCPAPPGQRSLSESAAQIAPGQWLLDPITINADLLRWDISWQGVTAFWDDTHRELQYMGKPQASAGGEYRSPHWIYDEVTDAWRKTTDAAAYGKLGHVWGVAFDHTNDIGRYYFIEQEPQLSGAGTEDLTKSIRYMDRSIEAGRGTSSSCWSKLKDANYTVHPDNIQSGLCYHPNLFGTSRPGLHIESVGWGGVNVYNFESQTYTRIDANQTPDFRGPSVYIPNLDVALIGSGSGAVKLLRGGAALETKYEIYETPIGVDVGTGNLGKLILDPRDKGVAMLLESKGSRVWTSLDGGRTWVEAPFRHPFWDQGLSRSLVNSQDGGSWTCASVSRYGCVLGLYSYNPGSILWRPGSL